VNVTGRISGSPGGYSVLAKDLDTGRTLTGDGGETYETALKARDQLMNQIIDSVFPGGEERRLVVVALLNHAEHLRRQARSRPMAGPDRKNIRAKLRMEAMQAEYLAELARTDPFLLASKMTFGGDVT
jgi:hypothetical protein